MAYKPLRTFLILRHQPVGVRRLLGDGAPRPLPPREVEALLATFGAGPRLMADGWRVFREGERVRVRTGPLAGLEGICKLPGAERCKVLLRLLNGEWLVDLRADWLEAAPR